MPYTLYNSCRYWIICRTLESYFLTRITAHQSQIEVWNVTEPSWLFRHFLHCLCTISHFHLSSCVTKIEVILLVIIITIHSCSSYSVALDRASLRSYLFPITRDTVSIQRVVHRPSQKGRNFESLRSLAKSHEQVPAAFYMDPCQVCM